MRNSTMRAALQHLPATRAELATKAGRSTTWAVAALRELQRHGYAEQHGEALSETGHLVPSYRPTGKAIPG